MKRNQRLTVKNVLYRIIIILIGFISVLLMTLYIETFSPNNLIVDKKIVLCLIISVISIITGLLYTFTKYKKHFIYRLTLFLSILLTVIIALLYVIKTNGLYDKINNIDDLRRYIDSFGKLSAIIFIILQFLQVVILPIPSFITICAGVILFGPLKCALYSVIGIVTGSITAFFLGRIFGVKLVKWLIGEDKLNKTLNIIKGKDKVILTFMFLFPFFPDDILCFVAGITKINGSFFVTMITIVRIITVFTATFSVNNSLIPYNTWWGILIWIMFFIFTLYMFYVLYKKGDLLQSKISMKLKSSVINK